MRVMIVDNDEAWTRSLEILLKQRGYDVAAFTEPERACDYIDQIAHTGFLSKADLPDAVVLDYVMPRLSGFQVLARIASLLKEGCVVVFVTGHGDQLKNVDLKQMGVAACLEKPVGVDELIRALEGTAREPSTATQGVSAMGGGGSPHISGPAPSVGLSGGYSQRARRNSNERV